MVGELLFLPRYSYWGPLWALFFVMCFNGCSLSQKAGTNYAFGISSGNIVAYDGMPMVPSPAFTVFQLQTPLTAFTSFSDSVQLQAFSDSKCTQAATGTFIVTP